MEDPNSKNQNKGAPSSKSAAKKQGPPSAKKPPSAKAAAGGIAGASAGSSLGAALGGTIGSFVPGAGNAAGAAVGSKVGGAVGSKAGAKVAGGKDSSNPSSPPENSQPNAPKPGASRALSSVAGSSLGAAAGAAVGTSVPGVGNVVGGAVGSKVGASLGSKAGGSQPAEEGAPPKKKRRWLMVLAIVAGMQMFIMLFLVMMAAALPVMVAVNFKDKASDFLGIGSNQIEQIKSSFSKEELDSMGKYKDQLALALDCSSLPPEERRSDENCIEGLLADSSEEGDSQWTPVPENRRWLAPIWIEAGKRYNVPWELIASVSAARSSFGSRHCDSETGVGFYQIPKEVWQSNDVEAGSAKTERKTSCPSSSDPAKVSKDMKKPLKKLSDSKGDPMGGDRFDAVDSTFATARILAKGGAFGEKGWEYNGSRADQCTANKNVGLLHYAPEKGLSITGPQADVKGAPQKYIPFYREAASKYKLGPKGPPMLAAIHSVETGFGSNLAVSYKGAQGHMQFMPPTWEAYGVDADGDGKKDPWAAKDAIFGAANYLSASGAPKDWYKALLAYNPADWYVRDVQKRAKEYTGQVRSASVDSKEEGAKKYRGDEPTDDVSEAVKRTSATKDSCYVAVVYSWYEIIKRNPPSEAAQIPINLPNGFKKLFAPKKYVLIPEKYRSCRNCEIDARVLPNLIYLLEKYDMVVTQGLGHSGNGSPSVSHNDGTGVDFFPRVNDDKGWDKVEAAARAVGWTPECGSSGSAPACPLNPAVSWVGYTGAANHGRGHHLHISWTNSCESNCKNGILTPPREWIVVFGKDFMGKDAKKIPGLDILDDKKNAKEPKEKKEKKEKKEVEDMGIAILLPGEDEVNSSGGLQIAPAWSTMKVAVAAALIKQEGGSEKLSDSQKGDIKKALQDSNNSAAERLRKQIDEIKDLEKILSNEKSKIKITQDDKEPTPGLTPWSLSDQVLWLNELLREAILDKKSVSYLTRVMSETSGKDQSTGFGQYGGIYWKGGWGPVNTSSSKTGVPYIFRQFGMVDVGYGEEIVAAMVEGETFGDARDKMDKLMKKYKKGTLSLSPGDDLGGAVSSRTVEFIAKFEGFPSEGRPYNDPVGHCTIGYGHLIHLGGCTSADKKKWGQISEKEAKALLKKELASKYNKYVDQAVKVPITAKQRTALVSLTYNIGGGGFQGSTVVKELNRKNYKGAAAAFMMWNKAGGGVLEGLTRRRAEEAKLFLEGSR